MILGATVLYWFAALLTKWSGFVERDPIESGRLYTLFTIWLLPEVPSSILTTGSLRTNSSQSQSHS